MRILFIGDPHIKVDNLDIIDKFIDQLKTLIIEENIELVIIGGDLMHYHERLHTLALNKSIEFCMALSALVKTYVLVGNHDMINNQQFLNENHWMNCLKGANPNLIVCDKPLLVKGDYEFILVPYVFPGRFHEALRQIDYNYKDADIIFAHQEFKGCKMGAIVSEIGDVWDPSDPLVISGHIHEYQKPQKNIFYPGAPLQHAFGDKDDNIVLLIDLEKGNPNFKEISTELAHKKIIYTDMSKIKDIVLDKEKEIKITLECTNDEFKTFKKTQKYKELMTEGVKVVCKNKTHINLEEKTEASKDETNFEEILRLQILDTKNKIVYRDFERIFYD